MKSSYQVVLTESSIVVLFKGTFQTSIPLRQWSTRDGSTWSSLLRQNHQIDWLMREFTDALNDASTESTMLRVLRVLADTSMPPRVPPRPRPTAGVAFAPREESSITPSLVPPRAPPLRRYRSIRPPQPSQPVAGVSLTMSP
jgi:hypothetical protein